jgi:hypothetical protein
MATPVIDNIDIFGNGGKIGGKKTKRKIKKSKKKSLTPLNI